MGQQRATEKMSVVQDRRSGDATEAVQFSDVLLRGKESGKPHKKGLRRSDIRS